MELVEWVVPPGLVLLVEKALCWLLPPGAPEAELDEDDEEEAARASRTCSVPAGHWTGHRQ